MKCVFKRTSLFRELVLDANGRITDDPSGDHIFCFERPKPLGKHSIRDVRDGRLDQGVSFLALQESLNDGPRPPFTDELNSTVETRTDVRDDFGHEENLGKEALDTSNLLKYTTFCKVSLGGG